MATRLTKYSDEQVWLGVDYARRLRDGDSVIAVSGITAELSGADVTDQVVADTVGDVRIQGDTVVQFLTAPGQAGGLYRLSVAVLTADGETLLAYPELHVVER